jgi:NAD(P)-dependent dehydrogenase (short-subunit alcohol dehydrogenase family)
MANPKDPSYFEYRMKTIIVTGATRGLGLATARALDAVEDVSLVLAVRDVAAGEATARTLRRPARVVALDLASLADVRRFAAAWREPLYALVNNAGVQPAGAPAFTTDGIEQALAVNWLAPLLLALELLPQLGGGRVLGIGSCTHDPTNFAGTMYGFRGGRFTSIAELAAGAGDGSL